MHKFHLKLGLHFLIAGHTKFGPDWCFGLFKQVFRKSRVDRLADIATVMAKSSEVKGVNLAQLVGNEDGSVLVETHDWQSHLTPYFRRLPQIKSYQHFSFDSERPGVVMAKKHRDAEVVEFQLLKDPAIRPPVSGLPVLPPPGLDMARQQYLFKEIRKFCRDDAKDITCPEPKSTARPHLR